MSIQEKIEQGEYINQLSYVRHSKDPAMSRAYDNEERRLISQFAKDIAEEYGLQDHPRAAVLFNLAWEEGHAHGYFEVANYYDRFAVLLT